MEDLSFSQFAANRKCTLGPEKIGSMSISWN
jgi:hypothetical protein